MLHHKLAKIVKKSVAYNFGCRALWNLSWRVSVSSHQVQCNISLLWKNVHHFLERCRKSNNVRLHAMMQSDCLYSSLFFGQHNGILLCEWVLGHCVFVWGHVHATILPYFIWPLTRVGPCVYSGCSCLLWMQCCTKCYGLVNNSVSKVSVTLLFYLQTRHELLWCVCFYQSALCRQCVFVLYGLSVCYKTLKLKKLNKFTKKFIGFYNLFEVRGAWAIGKLL